jgi:hypothetical protein
VKAGSEAAFQRQIEQLAGFYGWTTYHTHDSRRSAPGFPDLVLVRPPELIFAELKTDKGRIRPEQQQWLTMLYEVSVAVERAVSRGPVSDELDPRIDTYVWRPRDFDDINDRLARHRRAMQPLYRPSEDVA